MNEIQIKVPTLNWLIGGSKIGGSYNTYTGSIGTDPLKGIFNNDIFNYNISIQEQEDQEVIVVKTFYGVNCIDKINEDDIQIHVFDAVEDSIEQINELLKSLVSTSK